MTDLGTISRRDKVGLKGRGKIIWAACPECGHERWVPFSNPTQLCRICSGKHASQRQAFREAKHRDDCNCQRCKAKAGNLRRENSPTWKGGRSKTADGYVYVRLESDDRFYCMTWADGAVLEHRLVMARTLGRPLRQNETVHHINGKKDDNRPENLELWAYNHSNGVRADQYHCPGCMCHKKGKGYGQQDYSI